MSSKRKTQHDGLAREDFDEVTIRKSRILAPSNSNITISLPSSTGTLLVDPQVTPLTITNTTESTNKDTGALIVEGGVGIEKNTHIGGNLHLTSASSVLQLNGDLRFNKSGFTNTLTSSALTASRTITVPNATGTVALTSDFATPIIRYGNNLGRPITILTGSQLPTASFALTGKRLLVMFFWSCYTDIIGGVEYTLELNIYSGPTPLTVLGGTKSIKFYINEGGVHFTIPPIIYTINSGYASGNYNASVRLTVNTGFQSDSNDPYTLVIQELP